MQAYNWRQRHLEVRVPIWGHWADCYPQNSMHVGAVGRYWTTEATNNC